MHKTCKCKCRLDAIVCNNKQRWKKEKCRCECKELIDKGVCDKWYIWNLSNCECECDKLCDISEYLDYKNCRCRKKIVDKLVDDCNETVEQVKPAIKLLLKMKIVISAVLTQCIVCYFGYVLQLTLVQ